MVSIRGTELDLRRVSRNTLATNLFDRLIVVGLLWFLNRQCHMLFCYIDELDGQSGLFDGFRRNLHPTLRAL